MDVGNDTEGLSPCSRLKIGEIPSKTVLSPTTPGCLNILISQHVLFAFGFLRAHLLGGRRAEGESPAGTGAISHRDHHSGRQEDPQARLG